MSRRSEISRRTVLRGLGATLALPLLEAMGPQSLWAATPEGEAGAAAATSGSPPLRTAFLYLPNGAIMEHWTPKEVGESFTLPASLEPLAPHQGDLLVLSGLAHDKARSNGDGPGDHARSTGTFLTGVQLRKTEGKNIRAATSVDQIAAEHLRDQTRLASLELGIERGKQAGNCDSGYSCAYSSNISWRTPSMPMAKEIHPRAVFERLFGDLQMVGEQRDAARAQRRRRSVLDAVQEEARALRRQLGGADTRKLSEYLEAVRDVERRVAAAEAGDPREVPPEFDVPVGVPHDYAEHVELMLDLMVLAMATDTTRVVTFMFGNGASNRPYPQIGIRAGHHDLSHHDRDEQKIEQVAKINRFHMNLFAALLKKMKAVEEGEGTLLDNSMVLCGSGISDGNRHAHHNLPVVLAGRGGGSITTGRHLKYRQNTPLCSLYLSMLDRIGVQRASFGDSRARLENLA
ncbi:MAG: DUF1552 domain-containing protein [Planctomycetota bacterium]|nr:MAG: DUF1552 domain-containing protein [Planctomycetota bacterium]REK24992.1 MAG: DUF1552 domain-containing protein [Planctomycetota bacterium]REK42195.1 MAG: DUF1552 domain-containing protein [Planctomycetota bacterium]